MKHKILTVVLCALLVPFMVSGQTTQRLTADKLNEYAIIYSLPKTVFDITIETEHTVRKPGDFANYAKRHLGMTGAVTTQQNTVKIKSINITPRGVADPEKRYAAQFKAGSGATMLLDEAEVPLALNLDNVTFPEQPSLPKANPIGPSVLETDAARHALTLDITRASSQSKKAELTAQRIFELREQRNDLISGNVENMPPDGGAIQVALDNLNAQEAALTAMFMGTTQTFTDVRTVTFVPGENDSTDIVIARISPIDGIVDVNDLTGMPLRLDYKVLERGKLPENEKGQPKTFPKGGLAYNIPGSGTVALKFNGMVIASEDYDIAQLGMVFGVDPSWFTKKNAQGSAEFSPITGAIVKLASGTAVSK